MPLPKPNVNESEDEFVSRCVSDEKMMEEFPEKKQRLGVCYDTFRESKHKNSLKREYIIPVVRSFTKDGEHYVYGYGAVFDSPDELGTVITKGLVEENIPRLREYPSLRFMHETPLGRIVFDKSIELDDGNVASTRIDSHGFHLLAKVFTSCEKEWSMIQEGGWGLSYALSPVGLVRGRRQIGDEFHESFEHGKLYEFSVVDSPAHPEARAGVVVRIHSDNGGVIRSVPEGDLPQKLGTGGFACKVGEEFKLRIDDEAHVKAAMARYNQAEGCQTSEVKGRICAAAKHFGIEGAFEEGGFCYEKQTGEKREMDNAELEQWLKDAEKRITDNVTKAIGDKKADTAVEGQLKAMEERIMSFVQKTMKEVLPEKRANALKKTFDGVEAKIAQMDAKIADLRSIEKSLTEAGEDAKGVSARVTQLETERETLAKSITESVEGTVKRMLGETNQRITAIENTPEFRSPSTFTSGVQRSIPVGFRDMLDRMEGGQQ